MNDLSDYFNGLNFTSKYDAVTNGLYKQIYDIKFQLDSQISRAILLKKNWKNNLGGEPYTFNVLIDHMCKDRERCIVLLNSDYKEDIMDAGELKPFLGVLFRYRNRKAEYRIIISDLTEAYNERLEGKQISTSFEPSIRLGDKYGAHDQIIEVIERIIRTYVGNLNLTKLEKGPFKYLNLSETTNSRIAFKTRQKNIHFIPEWNGIVTTTSGSDFQIAPDYHLLYCTEHIKQVNHNLLDMIVHEGSHYIYRQLFNYAENIEELQTNKPEHPLPIHKLFWIEENIIRELLGFARNPSFDKFGFKGYMEVKDHLKSDYLYINYRYVEEIFMDLLAGVLAGPSYYLSLMDYINYEPRVTMHRGFHYDPPNMDRIYFGLSFMKALGLNDDYCWFRKYAEKVNAFEKLEKYYSEEIQANPILGNEKSLKDYFYGRCLYNEIGSEDDYITIEKVKANEYSIRPTNDGDEFYTLRKNRIDSLFIDDYYILELLKFFKEWFTPSPSILDECLVDKKGNYMIDKKCLNNLYTDCTNIAERIWYKSEIVYDQPIQKIIAASNTFPIRRPGYPSGKINYSILLSNK